MGEGCEMSSVMHFLKRQVAELYNCFTGAHQRSFERYHPRPPMSSSSARLGVRNPHPKLQSLLSQGRVKLRTSNLASTFIGSFRTKAH